jgi:membrane protease YdiL (CAAX protease family)
MLPRPDGAVMPPGDGLPRFSWATVAIFALNPAAFLVLPLFAVTAFKFNVLGPQWALNVPALRLGALFTAPVLALTLMPLDRIPGLSALSEVTRASKTICLYAFGSRLAPLRASGAAVVLATSAALCEELAFRGTMMGGVEALVGRFLPARPAALLALAIQALVFGRLHSYTNSAAYFIAATVAGALFGGAYLCSRNLAVPILMHFVVDMVSFGVCHVQVSRSRPDEKRALVEDPSPIATALRRAAGGMSRAQSRARPPAPASFVDVLAEAEAMAAEAIAAEAGEGASAAKASWPERPPRDEQPPTGG